METAPLRRFLQSLCDNSCWNYAVFWKLQHQNKTLLMWEDGYFGTLKDQYTIPNMFAEPNFGSLEETSSCNTYNGALSGDAVELAVAYMSTFQYALADGDTGNCRWLFADSKSGEFNTASTPEHTDEWVFQFAAGVKSILLVPVIPYGVLQLGSLEDLVEDAQMANYINAEFFAQQNFMGHSDALAPNQQFSSPSTSSFVPTVMRSFDEFPSFISTIDSANWSNHKQSTRNLVTPTCDSGYLSHLTGTDAHTPSVIELSNSLHHQLTNLINSEAIESSKSVTSVLASQPLISDVGSYLSFPKECELHKALFPAFMEKADDSICQFSIGDDDMYSFLSQISRTDINSSSKKIDGMLFCKENVQNPFSNVQISGDSLLSNSFRQFTSLSRRKTINERSATEGESSLFSNHVAPASFSRLNNHNDSSSPSGITYEGIVNELIEEEEQKSNYNILHESKSSKPSIASKKRGKPGAKKTRPRDRQLIQDRLKDLRELIPDGAKCSIDSLLDRTLKHTLFLESVGDRAIKLRQCVQPKGMGSGLKNNRKSDKQGSQNGASWAVEVGGDPKVCPILVEDLQCPGHMVIEMICYESFRFLEIAEVIHGLRLTILNGAMEKRSGNRWACYIVEVNTCMPLLSINGLLQNFG